MHPVIRLLCFVVFSLALALGQWPVLLAGAGMLLLAYWRAGCRVSPQGWRMLRRLRWFFLSIAVLYLWFTPGTLLWPALGGWSPSWEGLAQAAGRAARLAAIVLAADLLLQLTSREQLLSALYRLARPLAPLGFPAERFALRLSLTMEAVGALEVAPESAAARARGFAARLHALGEALLAHWRQALQASPKDVSEVELRLEAPPPAGQWLWPLALLLGFAWLGGLA